MRNVYNMNNLREYPYWNSCIDCSIRFKVSYSYHDDGICGFCAGEFTLFSIVLRWRRWRRRRRDERNWILMKKWGKG